MAYDYWTADFPNPEETVDISETPDTLDETTLFEITTLLTEDEMKALERFDISRCANVDYKRVLAKVLAVVHEMDRHGPVYQIRDGKLEEFNLAVPGLRG